MIIEVMDSTATAKACMELGRALMGVRRCAEKNKQFSTKNHMSYSGSAFDMPITAHSFHESHYPTTSKDTLYEEEKE
jgi:hypothetical protein